MEVEKTKGKRTYSVPALENAFAILTLLSRKRFQESTVTEIANVLSLNPATCYRILQSLEKLAIVRYLADKKRYTLGPYLVVLGERAREHLDYINIIMPYLESLTKETGMTSFLVNKISDEKVAIVAKIEASDFGVSVSIGKHFSIIDGSFGMCFLAYMDKDLRNYYLKQERGLKSFSDEEIALMDGIIEKIKQEGFYITYGEYIKGMCGIAAPIVSSGNTVDMSISLIGSTSQYEMKDLEKRAILIKEAAYDIGKKISNF